MLSYHEYKKRYGPKTGSMILKRIKKLKIKSKSKSSKVLYNELVNYKNALRVNHKKDLLVNKNKVFKKVLNNKKTVSKKVINSKKSLNYKKLIKRYFGIFDNTQAGIKEAIHDPVKEAGILGVDNFKRFLIPPPIALMISDMERLGGIQRMKALISENTELKRLLNECKNNKVPIPPSLPGQPLQVPSGQLQVPPPLPGQPAVPVQPFPVPSGL